MMKQMEPPSFKHLDPKNFNKMDDKQLESIEKLTKFHIDSFDWMIDQGLQSAIKHSTCRVYAQEWIQSHI